MNPIKKRYAKEFNNYYDLDKVPDVLKVNPEIVDMNRTYSCSDLQQMLDKIRNIAIFQDFNRLWNKNSLNKGCLDKISLKTEDGFSFLICNEKIKKGEEIIEFLGTIIPSYEKFSEMFPPIFKQKVLQLLSHQFQKETGGSANSVRINWDVPNYGNLRGSLCSRRRLKGGNREKDSTYLIRVNAWIHKAQNVISLGNHSRYLDGVVSLRTSLGRRDEFYTTLACFIQDESKKNFLKSNCYIELDSKTMTATYIASRDIDIGEEIVASKEMVQKKLSRKCQFSKPESNAKRTKLS